MGPSFASYRLPLGTLLLLAVAAVAGAGETPAGFRIDGDLRLRGEQLTDSFRPLAPGTDRVLASRLRLRAAYAGARWGGMLELQDARLVGAAPLTPVGTDDVNALEPLQAWVRWRPRPGFELRLGRQTVDFGSRRLLARNRYRNTANGFSGARLRWALADGARLQALLLYPDRRRPDGRDPRALRANAARLDPLAEAGYLSGVTLAALPLAEPLQLDAYVLRRVVDDGPRGVGDRDITTVGGRLLRVAGTGWYGELEAALQVGRSRLDPRPGAAMGDHRAWFLHGELRHPLPLPVAARLRLQLDVASGDGDPGDDRQGRFDKLFGARASELGPTGIYGFFDRSNLLSPAVGLRLGGERLALDLDYRAGWLESERDRLPSAGLRDPAGEAGDFLGHQWSARATVVPAPALTLSAGAVYLDRGKFLRQVTPAAANGAARYLWFALAYRF